MKKVMKIYHDKCTGCRYCEIICSLRHLKNAVDPKQSRIRVYQDDERFFPIIAGATSTQECRPHSTVFMGNEEFEDCALCRASCPSRPWFKDPNTGKALKCSMCGDCVEWCPSGALEMIQAS